MPKETEVRKIVLLPRFTSFAGARAFKTVPIDVRAFASARVHLWVGTGVGSSPTFSLEIQESLDLEIWNTVATLTPTPGTELADTVAFDREWMRLVVTVGGTDPAFTGWCVGEFVTRAPRM